MKIYLDESKEDILKNINNKLDKVKFPGSTQTISIDDAWRELYYEFNAQYPYGGYDDKINVLEKAVVILDALKRRESIIDGFETMLESMKPESEIDNIFLKDDNE